MNVLKIEQSSTYKGINFTSVNFPTKTLTIEIEENSDVDNLIFLITKTVSEAVAHDKGEG